MGLKFAYQHDIIQSDTVINVDAAKSVVGANKMDFMNKKYKLSQYNVYHHSGDMQYMWNTYSNALLELDKEAQEYVQTFSGVDDNSFEFRLLKDNGFIVFEQLDEYERVCLEEKLALYSPLYEFLAYVIAPGTGCNYSCPYCFEANSDLTRVMSPEIAVEVADYICQQYQYNKNVKEINILWFGGEPLLYMDIIEIISRKIMAFAQQNNLEYTARMVTNGRYLDEGNFALLQELGLKKIQITIDGTCDAYCKGKGASPDDFDAVIKNICDVSEKMLVNVRLNIPDNDVSEAIAVTDYLFSELGLLGKINLNFAYVCDYSLPPDAARQRFVDYVKNYGKWTDYLLERYSEKVANKVYRPDKRRPISCSLIKAAYNACIGPHGEMYKCEHSFGNDSMIAGDIWHGKYYNKAETAYYVTIDHPSKSKCQNCKHLPVCMGGCQNDNVNKFENFDCEALKSFQLKLKLMEGGVFSEIAYRS